ncbi:MAG TPA: PH domain-containing protein [Verrucomicrobiae bacterium]|nr:PH domain-containing protein [Verrucomicrobiae bacterium]
MKSTVETTLACRRVHWGIFVLPILPLGATILAIVPAMLVVNLFKNMLRPIGSEIAIPYISHIIALLALPGVTVCIALLVIVFIAYNRSSVTLTDRRLHYRIGLVSCTSGELPLSNVDAIFLSDSLLGRLLGYGTITVTTVGGLIIPFYYVPDIVEFHRILQKAIDNSRHLSQPESKPAQASAPDAARYMPKA